MANLIIAVDSGKSETKTVVINKDEMTKSHFPTAIGYVSNGRSDLLEGTHQFSCKALGDFAKDVVIGSEDLPIKADSNYSKDSDINKICTMYAIAINVHPGDTVNVAVGCPLSVYLDKEARTEYGRNIVPSGRVECIVDGTAICFNIDKKIVYAEGTGPVILHPELFTGEEYDAAVVDIGSLNMNIAGINNGAVDAGASHTSSHGGRALIAGIAKSLADKEISVNDNQIRNAIERGYIKCHDEEKTKLSGKIIENAIEDYIAEVETILKGSWKNYETLELFFIGGTSFMLRKYLLDKFGAFAHFEDSFDDARFSNAEGFARKLELRLLSK